MCGFDLTRARGASDMTREELSAILSRMYDEAPRGKQVLAIHLFGIRHARDIAAAGASARAVVMGSTLANSYDTEVQKGMNLSRHVVERKELRRVLLGEE